MSGAPDVLCPSCGETVPGHFSQCWRCQADLTRGAAQSAPRRPRERCGYCDGSDIETGIGVGALDLDEPRESPRAVGLVFAGASFLRDVKGGALEVLRADLCKDCGTITRWWIDEPDRLWVKATSDER